MNFAQILNGIALGSLLMILSSGLAMIYGLRGVTNFAHGALYMAGAYVAYTVSTNVNFWAALIVFVAVQFAIAYTVIRFRRRSNARPEQVHGSKVLEIAWTVVPALILLMIGIRLLLGPSFFEFLLCNVFWVNWESIRGRWSGRARRNAGAERAPMPG